MGSRVVSKYKLIMVKVMKVMKKVNKKIFKKVIKKKLTKKVMKVKAMKLFKKKTKRVSKIARGKLARSAVFRGFKEKTVGGLTKSFLIKNKYGKVVSKKASDRAKRNYKKHGMYKWITAVQHARKTLGVKEFCAVGGKSPIGIRLLAKARSLYKK